MTETVTVNGIIYTRTSVGWTWFDDRVSYTYMSAGKATCALDALSRVTAERDALLADKVRLTRYAYDVARAAYIRGFHCCKDGVTFDPELSWPTMLQVIEADVADAATRTAEAPTDG